MVKAATGARGMHADRMRERIAERFVPMAHEEHAQVTTSIPQVRVDVGMLDLIEALWGEGIETMFSCQGNPATTHTQRRLLGLRSPWVETIPGVRAYVAFADHADAHAVARLIGGDESRFTITRHLDERIMRYVGVLRFDRALIPLLADRVRCGRLP